LEYFSSLGQTKEKGWGRGCAKHTAPTRGEGPEEEVDIVIHRLYIAREKIMAIAMNNEAILDLEQLNPGLRY